MGYTNTFESMLYLGGALLIAYLCIAIYLRISIGNKINKHDRHLEDTGKLIETINEELKDLNLLASQISTKTDISLEISRSADNKASTTNATLSSLMGNNDKSGG